MQKPLSSFAALLRSILILPFIHSALCAAAPARITVAAGDLDRRETIVTFALPSSAPGVNALKAGGDALVPLQTDAAGQASFVLGRLPRGAKKTFELVQAKLEASAVGTVKAERVPGAVDVTLGGVRVLRYNTEKTELPRPDIKPVLRRGGYVHPILTPSGKVVTDDYPRNHLHHHGLWFAWTATEFEGRKPDFWNMVEAKGTVEFVALDRAWSGPVHAGFVSRHRFVDLLASEPKAALNEIWEVRAYNVGRGAKPYRMFDLISTQTCAGSAPLKLLNYRYGGIGFRGHAAWDGAPNCFFLTSEGEADRVKAHATRARWCHMGGKLDGALAGIAFLGHPDNFRAPEPMRVHPDEPFFNFAPCQAGDFEIAPGKPYVSRYRFIVSDGPPDKAELDRLWNDYAHPPEVKVE
ncbi:MAG: PmoA family protein [Verrucomicrobia bacterium]|nr:PmoA family protein [Verrucomicrobiota bacterium]